MLKDRQHLILNLNLMKMKRVGKIKKPHIELDKVIMISHLIYELINISSKKLNLVISQSTIPICLKTPL